jgi:hypothetical protein
MTERITGKVAQIISIRELVINRGSEHGVRNGMEFAILNPQGARIVDPDTKEELGSVEIPKVLVKAVRVEPLLTVARTYVSHRRVTGGSSLSNIFAPREVYEVVETLRLTERPYLEELDETESYVKIGDPVVQVIGDEYITSPESE